MTYERMGKGLPRVTVRIRSTALKEMRCHPGYELMVRSIWYHLDGEDQ